MLKYRDLDQVFHALADPSRRRMVEQLVGGPASVSQLAQPLEMSLAAALQHLAVLEVAGMVSSEKVGRIRTCRLRPQALSRAESWFELQRATWEQRLDRLGVELGVLEGDPGPDASRPADHENTQKKRRST